MEDMFTLHVRSGDNKKTTITIQRDASVEDLLRRYADMTRFKPEDLRLLFGSTELEISRPGRKMFLSDYRIHDRAILFEVFSLKGGSDRDTLEDSVSSSKQLPPDVELSTDFDMISWDDSENPRAKIPCCGKAIGPESLTDYCRHLLSAGKCEFRCPSCKQVWEYSLVCRLGVLTGEEMEEFETKQAENHLQKTDKIKKCPRCVNPCMRKNPKDKRVVCPGCRKEGRNIDFCWNCLEDWKTSGTTSCGNTACTGKDPRLKILEEAPRIEISNLKGCPSIRACPKCGQLIHHREACKHMVCTCGQKFCFICFKQADSDGNYQCGLFNSPCNIAPVQKCIHGPDADDDATDAPAPGSTKSSCTIL